MMLKLSHSIILGCMFCIIMLGWVGGSLSQEKPVIVNLMIDSDVASAPTQEQKLVASNSLINLTNGIDPKGINATLYVSEEMASANRLDITMQGGLSSHELAVLGNLTDERMRTMSASDQEDALTKAKDRVYYCHVCGGSHVDISGFRPEYFNQNEDTYKILEKLGIVYDAGFKAGLLYAPGHESDTWPYLIENYSLYAVPVSTSDISGDRVYLYDAYIKNQKKLTGPQWYSLLESKFNDASKKGDPMVVIFSNLVSGSGDYLDAYNKFIDYAISKKATFVTTMQLVNMTIDKQSSKPLSRNISANKNEAAASESSSISGCTSCDQTKNNSGLRSLINVSVKKGKVCLNCTNQTSSKSINKS